MVRVTIGIRGQVTLDPDLMEELGVKPGDEIDIEVPARSDLPKSANEPKGSVVALRGLFAHKANRPVSIEEMNEAVAAGWAGEVKL
ncbi:AbrB/MazE/SpoVT family DNA-binding domain-containing protein [Rhizobium sp. RU36D]|uniref:AbrB/MazE/SpoVT family DNA-binding domain-containing protein n=1 Tax=Rhizobium sp. RU36D TaxID=1907415 RepID=UPI0009D87F3D|nr:AbrB/MazE/SpoVT family DNA-binding domain-containing protein [Rhizobium sp. RU36D]SMC61762.1 transcriptional regulator, AbrB family [Rhizobium sp. RU36D]